MQKSTNFLTLLLSLSLLAGSMAFFTACGDEESSSGTSSSTESEATDTSDTEEESSDTDTSEDEDVVDNGDGTTTYSFEAEYVDLTYISGHGYSNEVEGVGCIVRDDYGANASNGYFVGYLYEEGNELEFYIYSDQDVSGAKLYLRATMEYQDYTMSWQEFEITVNDGDPIEYRDLNFSNVQSGMFSMNGGYLRAFSDFTIGSIDLEQGVNVIKLEVTNDTTMVGTARATAPIVDCIKIKTDSTVELSWDEDDGYPLESNLSRFS